MAKEWIDVSHTIQKGMVLWEGDESLRIQQTSRMAEGDMANVTSVKLSVHTGTHMDAPLHFIQNAKDMTFAPLDILIGKAILIETGAADMIDAAFLDDYQRDTGKITSGARLLFKTRNSDQEWIDKPFQKDYAAISADGAQWLVEHGVAFLGVDYLSVAPYKDLVTTHEILLGAEVWVVEGLDLRQVSGGEYEMVCLPLKIKGSDGSPARVALKKIG